MKCELEDIEELYGLKVIGLFVSKEHDLLKIVFEEFGVGEKNLILRARGDCCALCWWADVVGAEDLIGGMFLEMEEIDWVDSESRSMAIEDEYGEYNDVYGIALRTDKGICRVAFRASHNGYYGGYWEIYHNEDDTVETEWVQINDEWLS